MTERRVLVGMIHGRFQPFHNGHLEYLRESVERSGAIVVGITNADRGSTRHEETDVHRSAAEANPWTYLERYRMIRGVLAAEGLGDCAVVPFPIFDPTLLASYVEPGTTHFIRVLDDWGREKAARLRAHGHSVVELPAPDRKHVSGSDVRERLRSGGDWRSLVPLAVAEVIDAQDLHRSA